jgi:hypothetical protein
MHFILVFYTSSLNPVLFEFSFSFLEIIKFLQGTTDTQHHKLNLTDAINDTWSQQKETTCPTRYKEVIGAATLPPKKKLYLKLF